LPRPRLSEPSVDWKLNIPASVAGLTEHIIFNRTLGKPRYGVRTKLVTALLRAWLREQRARIAGEPSPDAFREVPNLEDLIT
jgi:hypothetical protein